MGIVLKNTNITGGKLQVNTPPKWWIRNPNWLPMPEILPTDNKFAGLFAVFEDGFNAVALRLNNGSHTIDWGDGTTSSGSGSNQVYNKTFNYSLIGGKILQTSDNRNYKQIIITVTFTNVTNEFNIDQITTPTTGTNSRPQNWLDIIVSSTNSTNTLTFDTRRFGYCSIYLERIVCLNQVNLRQSRDLANIKVINADNSVGFKSNELYRNTSDFRFNEYGDLCNYFNTGTGFQNVQFNESLISEFGNINIPNASNIGGFFTNCKNLKKVGNMSFISATDLTSFFQGCFILNSIGTINVNNATTINSMFNSCYSLGEIIFTGSLSLVTVTTNAFAVCRALRRLIIPGLRVGFDIRATQITGQNLQDLFTSLGTAT